MTEHSEYPINRFVREFKVRSDVRGDRGYVADLRHAFSDVTAYRAWPHLAPYCNLRNRKDRLIWQTVAGGLATLGSTSSDVPFGRSLKRMEGTWESERKSELSGRVRRLITCQSSEELCLHLPGIFRLAKSRGVDVDFVQLFWDLVQWENEEREVPVKWASYYLGDEVNTASEDEA